MFRLFGREQVVWLALIAAVAQVATSYGLDVSGKAQGIVTAVVVFVFAVGNAVRMHDGIIALATGVVNALFSLFAALNLHWTTGHQTVIVGALTLLLGFFTRQVVGNPIPAKVSPAGRLLEKEPAA
jgi:UDP-N-acetylmuramyl pentapeptide phosphotransferase/UDP-N-acetylglucosamine-1-phosphate transferase